MNVIQKDLEAVETKINNQGKNYLQYSPMQWLVTDIKVLLVQLDFYVETFQNLKIGVTTMRTL